MGKISERVDEKKVAGYEDENRIKIFSRPFRLCSGGLAPQIRSPIELIAAFRVSARIPDRRFVLIVYLYRHSLRFLAHYLVKAM